ncbi:MAG: hypothetical protein Q7R73_04100 [bacterium]|nr:hypothetical protein [bacterium]
MRSLILALLFSVIGFAGTAFAAVASACPELTGLQKFAGLMTFGNIMLTAGILGSVGFLAWLLYLVRIPAVVYEVCGYTVSLGLVLFAKRIPLGVDPAFIAFAGCICFAAMILVSAALHNVKRDEAGYCMMLAVTWAAVAVAYQSELIGFFAVAALFGALGFFVRSYPFMTVIGFEDRDALNRATGAAFVLLVGFISFRISGITNSYAQLFSYGTYLIGSLVGFTGLLILAYEGYGKHRGYISRQIPIIVGGIAALFFGSVLAIPELQKIGGTFFGLYLLEKICDVPTEGRVGFAFKGFVISCIALGAGYLILSHKDFFASYILMM